MQARYEPADLARRHRRAGQRLPLGRRQGRPGLRRRLPAAARAGLRRPGHVGEGRPQPALATRSSSPSRARSGCACGRRRRGAVVTVADTGIGVAAGRDAPAVRAVPPHRERALALQRGQRDRAGAGQGAGRPARRHHRRDSVGRARARRFTIRLPFGTRAPAVRRRLLAGESDAAPAGTAPIRSCRRRCAGCPASGRTSLGAGDGARSAARRPRRPRRVLVADDNADMREYLARLLHGAGYDVTAVADGQQALGRRRAPTCPTWSSAT